MKECKYRLPCDWCDKFNKKCEEVDYYESSKPIICDHDWVFVKQTTNTGGTDIHYKCRKCNAIFIKSHDGISYESGEWQP